MRPDNIVVKVLGKELTVGIEGITPIEAPILSELIEKKARELSKELDTHNTMTILYYLALELAADIHQLQTRIQDLDRAEERALERMIVALETVQKP